MTLFTSKRWKKAAWQLSQPYKPVKSRNKRKKNRKRWRATTLEALS